LFNKKLIQYSQFGSRKDVIGEITIYIQTLMHGDTYILTVPKLPTAEFLKMMTTTDGSKVLLPCKYLIMGENRIAKTSELFNREFDINGETWTFEKLLDQPFYGMFLIDDLDLVIEICPGRKDELDIKFTKCGSCLTEEMLIDILPHRLSTKSARNI
jgi:hypothetical protein